MKKAKFIFFIVALVCTVISFSSCSKDDDSNSNSSTLVGTWVEVNSDGSIDKDSGDRLVITKSGDTYTVVLRYLYNGEWITGKGFPITFKEDSKIYYWDNNQYVKIVSCSNDVLVIEESSPGHGAEQTKWKRI